MAVNEFLVPIMDATLKANRDDDKPRDYLGASIAGENCERKLAFGWHGRKPNFAGRTYRIFAIGHACEDLAIEWMRLAGFKMKVTGADGRQLGFSDAGGEFKGHMDGWIVDGPPVPGLAYPALWECKSMKDSKFKEFKKKGLKRFSDTYYGQAQIYMAHSGATNCLYISINKDTSDLWFEIIDYSTPDAQSVSDRAVRVIQTKDPWEAPRVASQPEDFRCKWCDFKEECWAGKPASSNKTEQKTVKPKWLQ